MIINNKLKNYDFNIESINNIHFINIFYDEPIIKSLFDNIGIYSKNTQKFNSKNNNYKIKKKHTYDSIIQKITKLSETNADTVFYYETNKYIYFIILTKIFFKNIS
jgi:hypothetical protein